MPSRKEIEEQNELLLRQQHNFRVAADHLAAALAGHPAVSRVVLFGSVAVPLWKEVPRFREYRRAGIEVWHECSGFDLAVWVDDLGCLPELRRLRARSLRDLYETTGLGVADHQADVFFFQGEPARCLGLLCYFSSCPKGKPVCHTPGCGDTPFLRQIPGFRLYADALDPDKTITLYPTD